MSYEIRVGISPCPNDTFIFKALHLKHIDCGEYTFHFEFADVQTLNESLQQNKYDLVKISFGALAEASQNYKLLSAGGAMGFGCGPLLIKKHQESLLRGCPIYLPGKKTTARLLFDFWKEKQSSMNNPEEFAFFDEIYQGLLTDKIEAGVIIHESRFVYEKDGLLLEADLGAFWEAETGYPIPLGGIVLHKDLAGQHAGKITTLLQESLRYAWQNPQQDWEWMQSKAQIAESTVMKSHIETYVNDFSFAIGEQGRQAVNFLLQLQSQVNQTPSINPQEIWA